MKFKVGDKVRVKPISELKKLFKKNATKDNSMGWYYTYKLSDGSNRCIYFVLNMKDACGEAAKVISVDKERYTLEFEHNVFSENQNYEFVEDWLEPLDNPIYVSSFDDEEENKSERLKVILDQIEQLAAEARKIVEG